ncbi:hypothetical protein [Paenibacillus faecalis]|uniref:hypothetical protein n=1 Tax=Paenibacillus faecalis TaxID=2079532 RepID=UPI000D1101C6|nr:hypothetical protein [Paenibacillus faecalis]
MNLINLIKNQYKLNEYSLLMIEMIKRWLTLYLDIKNCKSVYLIGSLPAGCFVPGRSDCDLLIIINDDIETSVSEYKLPRELLMTWTNDINFIELFRGNDIKISCCLRSDIRIKSPFLLFKNANDEIHNWKDISAVEDLIMLKDHGVHLYGEKIRNDISIPTINEMRKYFRLRDYLLTPEQIDDKTKNHALKIAKSIIIHARECLLLWTGEYVYNHALILDLFCKKSPQFYNIDVLNEALDICSKSKQEIKQLNTNHEFILDFKDKQTMFFHEARERDVSYIKNNELNVQPISLKTYKDPIEVTISNIMIPSDVKEMFNE